MENIQTAVASGWIGIHLNVNDKDPVTTLRSDLTSLGVFAKKQIAKPLIKLAINTCGNQMLKKEFPVK